jgi:hypothetical protein
MATEGDDRIIAFLHPKRHVSPVVVPASRDESCHASAFCGPQKQQLSIQLQLRTTGVGANDGVDAGAGKVKGVDIIVIPAGNEGFQLLELLGWKLRGIARKNSYLVASNKKAIDEMLANVARCARDEYQHD